MDLSPFVTPALAAVGFAKEALLVLLGLLLAFAGAAYGVGHVLLLFRDRAEAAHVADVASNQQWLDAHDGNGYPLIQEDRQDWIDDWQNASGTGAADEVGFWK